MCYPLQCWSGDGEGHQKAAAELFGELCDGLIDQMYNCTLASSLDLDAFELASLQPQDFRRET